MIIAIDGPAGSGKSTTAKFLAKKIGFMHVNTGYMYRAIALKIFNNKIDINNKQLVKNMLENTELSYQNGKIYLDGENVLSSLTTNNVTNIVSTVSALSYVRDKLVKYQRKISIGNNVVLEGRDIGTVVFPQADYKFYITADIKTRAMRRKKEFEKKGSKITLEQCLLYIKNRDNKDISRKCSPLKKAEDAIEIDTTELEIDEQVNCIINIINNNK